MSFFTLLDRYLYKEITKTFLLFLGSFYLLYTLIDYTSRGAHSLDSNLGFAGLTFYYSLLFVKQVAMLFPFAMLLATIKVLLTLNVNRELIVLLGVGVPLKRILRPFILFALLLMALLYLNSEFIRPYASYKIEEIEDQHKSNQKHHKKPEAAFEGMKQLHLADGSLLISQSYDRSQDQLFDSYWIRGIDQIWRIKYLQLNNDAPPQGLFADQLVRSSTGELQLENSYESLSFPGLAIDKEVIDISLRGPEELSLSRLWSTCSFCKQNLNTREATLAALFHDQLANPLSCLLAVVAPAPFCIHFSRRSRILLIFILAISGAVVFHLIANAILVVAQSQSFSPALTIYSPYLLYFAGFLPRFTRL